MSDRESRDVILMVHSHVVALRATCDRARVGCVIASSGGRILSAGYNGSTPGADHCDEDGHLMKNGHCIRTVHAEANAISNAASNGVGINGCIAYCTHRPCILCSKQMMCAGIIKIFYSNEYDSDGGVDQDLLLMFSRSKTEVVYMPLEWLSKGLVALNRSIAGGIGET